MEQRSLPQNINAPQAIKIQRDYVPFLKWAGGKSALLSQYQPFFPTKFGRYFEPFTGSGAVFFHLRGLGLPQEYFLSDINDELINLYCVVRDHLDELVTALRIHKESHSKEHYYAVRALDRGGLDGVSSVERAARMIYLNRTCFNGLWRVNSKGQFNVPMGKYSNPAILDVVRLSRASYALQGVQIRNASFQSAVADAQKDDFVYFDPPYVPVSTTSSFTGYASNDFGEQDQRALADVFRDLHNRGCSVMLSNSDMPLVHQLYRDFPIHTVQTVRRINSHGEKRGEVSEVLITNYP
jgi:DNA adenine methylase